VKQILYTAAHGGYAGEGVPLGGGAAVCDHLVAEWSRTRPFPFRLITPSILGVNAPKGADLVAFNERGYAHFSRAFEHACTAEILQHDPASTVVLANDISEGPSFDVLAARGFPVFTIYHVDVVAYISAIYGRGLISPESSVRWYRRLRRFLPKMAQLVWQKQESSVRSSRGLIVPSEGMRETILRCYPECASHKVHVLPWGSWDPPIDTGSVPRGAVDRLRAEFQIPDNAQVLLTLSRISPEKGQDLLLNALFEAEFGNQDKASARPLYLFICGGAAYMQGVQFLAKLKTLAARLRHTRVIFPGHVTGDRKRAFFALADLYVFPSRHESYGLTLLEALSAGLPAVCLDHSGARTVMRPEFGEIVKPADLYRAIARLLADDDLHRRMSIAARAFAAHDRFSDRAAALADLLAARLS